MYTEIDNKKGLVRTKWKNIRDRVFAVNPEFTQLLDELPVDNLPVYLVYFRYGQLLGDTYSQFLPDQNDNIHRLNSNNLNSIITNELGYGATTSPLGIILEKQLEYYIDVPKLNLTLPRIVRGPGCIFPISFMYQNKHRNYTPSGILNQMSGCRSVFMLPNIGSKTHYDKLQYDFHLKSYRPENLYDHFNIFRELANGKYVSNHWRSCILYFTSPWIDKIFKNPLSNNLKIYLNQQNLKYTEPEAHKHLLDFVFSYIQLTKNLKPNPYIVDTARHIINTAIGNTPGYVPAYNEDYLPISLIEKPFIESYGMKKYFPTIMHPHQYIYEKEQNPIYYSLQYPATHYFSPKSRNASSMLVEMRELSTIMNTFMRYFAEPDSYCNKTIYHDISKNLDMTCIHNQNDMHAITSLSNDILVKDSRLTQNFNYKNIDGQRFSADGKFFRGCVAISKKTTDALNV
jgi:hypothetical protein